MLYLLSYCMIGTGLGSYSKDNDFFISTLVTFFGLGILREIYSTKSIEDKQNDNELIKNIGKYYFTPFILITCIGLPVACTYRSK